MNPPGSLWTWVTLYPRGTTGASLSGQYVIERPVGRLQVIGSFGVTEGKRVYTLHTLVNVRWYAAQRGLRMMKRKVRLIALATFLVAFAGSVPRLRGQAVSGA